MRKFYRKIIPNFAFKFDTFLPIQTLVVLKEKGLVAVFKNLQPVSNPQFLSKLTERAVFDQTYDRMMDLGLYPMFQSAYRKCHSTENMHF